MSAPRWATWPARSTTPAASTGLSVGSARAVSTTRSTRGCRPARTDRSTRNGSAHALGPETVQRLSNGSGLDIQALLPLLAAFLPQLINMLTPNGRTPDGGLDSALGSGGLGDLGGLLGGLMGGTAGGPGTGTLNDLLSGLGGDLGGDKGR